MCPDIDSLYLRDNRYNQQIPFISSLPCYSPEAQQLGRRGLIPQAAGEGHGSGEVFCRDSDGPEVPDSSQTAKICSYPPKGWAVATTIWRYH